MMATGDLTKTIAGGFKLCESQNSQKYRISNQKLLKNNPDEKLFRQKTQVENSND